MLWWIELIFGWVLCLAWARLLLPIFPMTFYRTLKRCSDDLAEPSVWPRLSVIIPARDEGPHITTGLASLLDSDYPNLEIIAINDRSRDDTGQIMDHLAADDSRLRVIHLQELPVGWLGKNHAMFCGQQVATGQWLLFTDGDIVFLPDALRRSVSYAENHQLDFLSLFPHMVPGGFWENSVVVFFTMIFLAGTKSYQVRTPKRAAYVGVGAFNLIRRSAYDATGGHTQLKLEILDDVRLAQMTKDQGFRCDVLSSGPYVSVRWQHSLWGAIRGLEKNGFAALQFSIWRLVTSLGLLAIGCLSPYLAIFLFPDVRATGYIGTLLLLHGTFGYMAWQTSRSFWLWLAVPVAMIFTAYAFGRSAWVTLRQGGVRWRDTFYPLDVLRKNFYRSPSHGKLSTK